jgi:preprotein translocase subunit SecF
MKRTIKFTRSFPVTVPISLVLIVLGMVGWLFIGFNNGVDFQAGMNTQIQIVPPAVSLTYAGADTYKLSVTKQSLSVLVLRKGGESADYPFAFSEYPTVKDIVAGLRGVPNLVVEQLAKDDVLATKLVVSAQKDLQINQTPLFIHSVLSDPADSFADIAKVRAALATLGSSSIQQLGDSLNQAFMIRVQDPGKDPAFSKNIASLLEKTLADSFGANRVIVNSVEFVGAAFSKDLVSQVLWLTIATFALILGYCALRFRIDYAVGAILSVVHDALIMVGFVVWTKMEFNTSTIAAILTVIGYSIMDTIVIYDRIREKVKMLPDAPFRDCLNMGVTETLSRTFITTGTTLLAVVALFVFTTGSLKNFALALFVGIVSGTYSSTFIASAFVLWWRNLEEKGQKKRMQVKISASSPAKT